MKPLEAFASLEADSNRFLFSLWMTDLILNRWEKSGCTSRREVNEAIIVALLRSGATEDEIRAVFQSFPIGKSYLDKGRNDQYLAHAIEGAAKLLSQHIQTERIHVQMGEKSIAEVPHDGEDHEQ